MSVPNRSEERRAVDEQQLKRLWAETLGSVEALESLPPGRTYRPAPGVEASGGTIDVPPPPDSLSGERTAGSQPETLSRARGTAPAEEPRRSTISGSHTAAARAAYGEAPAAPRRGRYDLLEEIGRGGMGVIYRARQESLDRDVAVKRLIPRLRTDAVRESFVAEALVTGILDHPNIVPVYDLGEEEGGDVFLAMKLIGGTSWKDLLHPESETEKKRAAGYDLVGHIDVLLSVCNAVAFAHSRGVIHRDVKPENVMIGEFGEVLVMDWGIACDFRDDAPSDTRAPHKSSIRRPSGTPSYMPPELAEGRGQDIGPWTDTYLLGAVLHEIVTGSPPHRAPTVMAALLHAASSPVPQYGADVPEELQRLLRKALAAEPGDRFGEVVDFSEALEAFLRHRQSLIVTENARRILKRCEDLARSRSSKHELYADFAEAVAALGQAQVLWEGNDIARQTERRARLSYAHAALSGGDLGLAAAQAARLGADDWEAQELREKIRAGRQDRAQQRRAASRLRWVLALALGTILVALGLGYALVRGERDDAIAARNEAMLARRAETHQRSRAERNADDARRAEAEARLAYARTFYDRGVGLAAEGRRQRAAACLLRAIEIAPPPATPNAAPDAWASEAWRLFRFLDAARGRVLRRWTPLVDAALAESPDPVSLAAGTARPTKGGGELIAIAPDRAVVLEATTGRVVARVSGLPGGVRASAISADGAWLVLGTSDGALALYALPRGENVWTRKGEGPAVYAVAIASDGKTIVVSASDLTVRVIDVRAGREARRLAGPGVRSGPRASPALALGFSGDGDVLVAGQADGTVRFFNARTWRAIGELETGGPRRQDPGITALCVSPDGSAVLVGAADGQLAHLDLLKRRIRWHQAVSEARITGVSATWDGGQAAVADADGEAHLLDLGSGATRLRVEGGGAGLAALTLDAAATHLSTLGTDGTVRRYALPPAPTTQLLGEARLPLWQAAFAARAPRVLTVPRVGAAAIWNVETGERVAALRGGDGAVCGALSADGARALTSGADRIVRVWDGKTGVELFALEGHASQVLGVAIRADGLEAASASDDGTIRRWDLATGRELGRFESASDAHEDWFAVGYSLDGTALAASTWSTKRVRLFDLVAGRDGAALAPAPGVQVLAFRPAARGVLTGASDGVVALWAADDGTQVRQLSPEGDPVTAIALARAGVVAAVGGPGGRVRVLDLLTGRTLRALRAGADDVVALRLSAEGHALWACDRRGRISRAQLVTERMPARPPAGSALAAEAVGVGFRVVQQGPRRGELEPVP